MSEAHVQEDLLAYLDGELDAAARARVEAHLEQCQLCAAELAQLRELRYGLNVTLDTALSSVRLSREADDRIREVLGDRLARHEHGRAWGGLANWFRALGPVQLRLAQASLALMVLLYSLSTGLALNITAPVQAHEVLVLGESRLAPGSQGALRVIVRDVGGDGEISGDGSRSAVGLSGALTGSPVAGASVMISLLTESGALAPLFAGATDALGTVNASFTVPDLPEGTVELVVETSSSTGVSRLTQQVAIARTYKIFVMSDKPAYRPGQTIALRALVLDAADLRPVTEGRLQWSVRDATGAVVGRAPVDLSSYGVGTWMYELPATVPEGDYQITATFGDTRSERTVRVEAYDLPAFRVALSLARTYAVPGEALGGTVAASYFFDMPVAASIAVVRGTVPELGDQPVVEVAGLTDADGHFDFEFVLPADLPQGELVLAAEVVDPTGQGAGLRRALPVSASPLVVQAVPESGVLKPGVANAIILMTTRPDGRPAAAELIVTAGGETQRLSTDRHGLASLILVATGDTELVVVARDESGAEARAILPLAVEDTEGALLLHTPRAAYSVGETLVARALTSGDVGDVVYLDVVRAGQMVAGLAAPVVDGVAEFALDLDPSLLGTLALRAYAAGEDGDIARDSRLVVVDPAQKLAVGITSDRERYEPGDMARLTFQTSELAGGTSAKPVPSLLAISVVDASVTALETLPPSFARTYMLINDSILARREQVAALDLPALLAAEDEARQAQDLAARAAWAGAPVPTAQIQATEVVVAPDRAVIVRQKAADRLLVPLIGLATLALVLVVGYLRRERLARSVLRRMVVAGLVLFLVSPVLLAGVVLGTLLPLLGATLFILALAVAAVLVLVILVHSFRRHWRQLQLFVIIVAGYLVLSGWLLALAAGGAEIIGWQLGIVVASFALVLMATLLEGQMMVVASMPAVGWSTVALALTLAVLAVTAPSVPALRSNLSEALGDPKLYVGPLGWLSGCAAAGTEAPSPVGTAVPEAAEEPEAEVPAEGAPTPGVTPMPTASPVPLDLPAEPYPLRQVFPETLYWNPAVETDAQGMLALDLVLADTITTWQVTALASTLDGDLGAASLPLVVSQDLILDVVAPERVTAGEIVTLTLTVYNTTAEAVPIRWALPEVTGGPELVRPEPVVVPPRSGIQAAWVLRPDGAGTLSLEIAVLGETAGDRLLFQLPVAP